MFAPPSCRDHLGETWRELSPTGASTLWLRLPPNRLPLTHRSVVRVALDVADTLPLISERAGGWAESPIAAVLALIFTGRDWHYVKPDEQRQQRTTPLCLRQVGQSYVGLRRNERRESDSERCLTAERRRADESSGERNAEQHDVKLHLRRRRQCDRGWCAHLY